VDQVVGHVLSVDDVKCVQGLKEVEHEHPSEREGTEILG
jgi:hypothetical protein